MQSNNNITHELRYFLYGFKLFGLSPYAQSKQGNLLLVIHSLILLAITSVLVVSAFIFVNIFEQSAAGTLASIVGSLMFCGLIATNVIILLQALMFRPEAAKIEDRFDSIHKLMQNHLFMDISVTRMKRRLFWKIAIVVSFLVVVIGFNFAALRYYDEHLSYNLHSLWPILIIRARCIHNIFIVDLITEYLNRLNGKLSDITSMMAASDQRKDDGFKIKYAQSDFKHLTKTPYAELMILKDVYGHIWDITNLMNDAFGWSLLAIATQNFIEFTCNGYWLFLTVDNATSVISAINAICTIIPVVFVLANIAYSCYCAIDSGLTTGSLIHRLEKKSGDEMHNALVREFSLQVAHEPITISANGFFNVDFNLLGSMAAATVTYLVILIQFQQSEKKKLAKN